jgi:hypothetical protein
MKRRKTLSLSAQAIARGEEIAAEAGKSLSAVIEAQLMAIPAGGGASEEFWPGPPLKPIKRGRDARSEFLKRKHG